MDYDKINELFEPIFQWIKEYYPDGAYFLVDKNSAKLYANETLNVFSEEIKNYCFSEAVNDIINTVLAPVEEETKESIFILNQDVLKK